MWLDSSGSGQCSLAVSYEYSNEPSGSKKGGEFLDQLSDYKILKKKSDPQSHFIIERNVWNRAVSQYASTSPS
jgi:hypothetical protein